MHFNEGWYSSIEYVKECVHLGNTIYSDISLKCIDGSVSDLFIRTNTLLYDFSNVDINILSKLHIGYEPAGLTVHPPPRMIEGGFIFFVWVSSATKIFS